MPVITETSRFLLSFALPISSDFPRFISNRGNPGKITLFQHLFEIYSKLVLSVPTHRSVAISRLESRHVRDLEPFPLVLARTQFFICIGDESKSYKERIASFCRPAKMIDHVERIHLKGKDPEARIECYHLMCKCQGLVLEHLQHSKHHVQTVHGVTLREPRFVRSTK